MPNIQIIMNLTCMLRILVFIIDLVFLMIVKLLTKV